MLKLHVSSIALGAVLATGAFLLMSQAGPGVPYGSWGPPKNGIVSIIAEGPISVPASGYSPVYQVPSDRWITITDAQAVGTGGAALRYAEEFGGVTTEKGRVDDHLQSVTGWSFRPGSRIVVTNNSISGYFVSSLRLIGYQTRD